MASGPVSLADKQKQNRAHEQAGDENPDRNEHTEFGEAHRAAQHQRKKSDCRCERAKKNRASESCH